MMQQETPQATPQQPAPQAPEAPAPATPAAAPQEAQPATLQEFALNLLNDPAALSSFQLDPEGVLSSCGLSDITPADVEEILPLVLDAASIADVDGLTSITDIATPASVNGLVGDFSGLGDVSSTLDGVLQGTDVVSGVADLSSVTGAVSGVTGVASGVVDLSGVTGTVSGVTDLSSVTDTVSGVTGTVSGVANVADLSGVTNVADLSHATDLVGGTDVLGTVTGVADVADVSSVTGLVGNVTDVAHNAVPDVAPVSQVHDVAHNVVDSTVGSTLGNVLGTAGDLDVLDNGLSNVTDLGLHL
jgi:hypothetical protein